MTPIIKKSATGEFREQHPLNRGRHCWENCRRLCHPFTVKYIVIPIMLSSALALAGCGTDDQSDASIERGAATILGKITLCVQNDSTRSISSIGDGSVSGPQGFVVRPGERACTSTSVKSEFLTQSMMSDEGPAWSTQLRYWKLTTADEPDYQKWSFSTCGTRWVDDTTFSAALSCSGNPFLVSGTIDIDDRDNTTANVIFADQ